MDLTHQWKTAAEQLGLTAQRKDGTTKHLLKKAQVRAIQDVLQGKDILVIAPMAFGKSAVYQMAALLQGGVTIVITPLLSLIRDQVDKLRKRGVQADYFCSAQGAITEPDLIKAMAESPCVLLYTTPESFPKLGWLDGTVKTVCVDECHCVTEFGYSFRKDYLRIGQVLQRFQNRPTVVALTATAPMGIREEICDLLGMGQVILHHVELYRKNLALVVRTVTGKGGREKALRKALEKYRAGACIIYCPTRESTERVYRKVTKWYPGKTAISHAQWGRREEEEAAFLVGQKSIMVCTSAFGMGVDKPDVRCVIHYGMPLSPIDYFQQVGRGGRDQKRAVALLLWKDSDYIRNQRIILQSDISQRSLEALDAMKELLDGTGCLQQRLLRYLGEQDPPECGKCSFCQRKRRKR